MLPDQAERVMSLSEDEFNSELAAALESKLGAIEWSDKRFVFPLRQRHALDYVKESIVLVGDAAHTIHPLAGQGVNLGLLDAKALAEELQRGIQAGRSVADPKVLLDVVDGGFQTAFRATRPQHTLVTEHRNERGRQDDANQKPVDSQGNGTR